jgi:hypothetical protein
MKKLPITEGITKLINQIPKAAACMPKVLSENNPMINTLAVALTGNSVKPIVGNMAITR